MMHNVEGMTQEKAYDIVRREFYALRHVEDIERRIAREEALKVGAYFGKSAIEVSMGLEDEQFENWKKWAGKQIDNVQAEQDSAYTNFGAVEESEGDDLDAEEPVAEPVMADKVATNTTGQTPNAGV